MAAYEHDRDIWCTYSKAINSLITVSHYNKSSQIRWPNDFTEILTSIPHAKA